MRDMVINSYNASKQAQISQQTLANTQFFWRIWIEITELLETDSWLAFSSDSSTNYKFRKAFEKNYEYFNSISGSTFWYPRDIFIQEMQVRINKISIWFVLCAETDDVRLTSHPTAWPFNGQNERIENVYRTIFEMISWYLKSESWYLDIWHFSSKFFVFQNIATLYRC